MNIVILKNKQELHFTSYILKNLMTPHIENIHLMYCQEGH